MSSATTHMRYILSKQKVLDLRTSSIFSAKLNDENIENYENYDDLLNSFETIHKKSEIRVIHSRSLPHLPRNTDLDDFFKFRGYLKKNLSQHTEKIE